MIWISLSLSKMNTDFLNWASLTVTHNYYIMKPYIFYMCRMFGYVGYSNEELDELYSALIEASRKDKIGEKYGYSSHDDGFGIVVYTEDNLFHFRSTKPIYKEKLNLPEFNGKIYAIFHALNAHDKDLLSPIFEHPFMVSNGNQVMYMAHNGVVDKQQLMENLGIKGVYNDTEAALEYLNKNGLNSISDLEDYTKSSLNVIILNLDKKSRSGTIYFKNFYHDESKSDYLDMYTAVLPHGKAVVSSTLTLYGIDRYARVTTKSMSNLEEIH